MRGVPGLLVLLAFVVACSTAARQSVAPPGKGTKTVRVAASERYRAGSTYRFLLGGGYRDLWEAKVTLPVLDLGKVGGGLTPTRRFGGLQSAVLGFKGADGRSYSFRGTDKDPSAVLGPMLRESAIADMVQDQMAAQHPGGPLVAGVLSEAAGVLTIPERMVVMPDDPALGEFRKEFAGMVGSFFEYPTPAEEGRPGFHGATAIIDHEELYERLSKGPEDQVHVEAYLRARLLDLLIGDFDRHRKQWRWAKLPGEHRWQPIPEDRDQAFVRYDGVGQRMAYVYVPILQCYGPDYPSMDGLTIHGWEQDRWLLAALDWEEWEAVIRDMRSLLSDQVIDAAIQELPPEYATLDGARLRADIRGRRDKLLEGARAFYLHLAGEVNVQGTDASEVVSATWSQTGTLRVDVRAAGKPVFTRVFDEDETDDVRIYLRGGDDVVTTQGAPGGIQLRVIGGEGKKTVDDSASGGAILYDIDPSADVRPGRLTPAQGSRGWIGPQTEVVDESYTQPKGSAGFLDLDDIPPRDWGESYIPLPVLGHEPGVGVIVGAGVQVTEYGFRKHPWSRSHRASVAFATGTLLPSIGYSGKYRVENSNLIGDIHLSYSGNEVVRYNGLGNETTNDAETSFYGVINHQVEAAPGLSWSYDDLLRLSGGVRLTYSNTQTEDGVRLINLEQPYGSGSLLQSGAFGRVVVDLRRSDWADAPLAFPFHDNVAAGYATGGALFDLRADVTPPLLDAEKAWGSLDGSVAGYLGLFDKGRVVLTGRVGGRMTWGKVPYFGSAYLGGGGTFSGSATARGFTTQRFAGDASLYANGDVRVFLFRFNLLVPADFGLTGFADIGRVFVEDESSDVWHPSGGGGIWFAPLARTNTITLSVAGSRENALFYARLGFHY